MLLKPVLITLFILSLLSGTSAKAEASNEFKTLIESPDLQKLKCDERWEHFWPLAKKGDLDARLVLLWLIGFRLHSDEIYPPGRSHDKTTLLRDIIILGVHSSGATFRNFNDDEDPTGKRLLISFFEQAGFSNRPDSFLTCFKQNPTQKCANIAVKEKIVPSFKEYATEIDAAIALGKKSTCIPFNQRP